MNAPIAASSERKQWRIVFKNMHGESCGACFVDAPDEAGALKFFAQAFPRSTVVTIKLSPVDPCAAYERRAP